MNAHETADIVERMATTLRADIGPAVGGEYQRTQAFMSAVVLEKLARQLRLADAHHSADVAARAEMFADIAALGVAVAVGDVEAAHADGTDGGLCALIEALYHQRGALGEDAFTAALGRVRRFLRGQIDRRMEIAR
jgi:hypothetical protein